jgi:hypothetical protein
MKSTHFLQKFVRISLTFLAIGAGAYFYIHKEIPKSPQNEAWEKFSAQLEKIQIMQQTHVPTQDMKIDEEIKKLLDKSNKLHEMVLWKLEEVEDTQKRLQRDIASLKEASALLVDIQSGNESLEIQIQILRTKQENLQKEITNLRSILENKSSLPIIETKKEESISQKLISPTHTIVVPSTSTTTLSISPILDMSVDDRSFQSLVVLDSQIEKVHIQGELTSKTKEHIWCFENRTKEILQLTMDESVQFMGKTKIQEPYQKIDEQLLKSSPIYIKIYSENTHMPILYNFMVQAGVSQQNETFIQAFNEN